MSFCHLTKIQARETFKMQEKLIKFNLSNGKTDTYRIKEIGKEYHVWDKQFGLFSSDKLIGKTRSFDDALAIARANVSGSIKSVDVK